MSLSRPFRAQFHFCFVSQGVALGWYVLRFQRSENRIATVPPLLCEPCSRTDADYATVAQGDYRPSVTGQA